MRERINEFQANKIAVIIVAPHNAKFINRFLTAFGPFPFRFVGDPKGVVYRQQGHHSTHKLKLFIKGLQGVITRKIKHIIPDDPMQKEVVFQSMKTQDVTLQGGTYLYSADGKQIWKHIDSSAEDHAKIDEILSLLSKLKTV